MNESEWRICLLYRAEVSPDGRQTPPDQHKNRTINAINYHTIATILHIVSFWNIFLKNKSNTKKQTIKSNQIPFPKK